MLFRSKPTPDQQIILSKIEVSNAILVFIPKLGLSAFAFNNVECCRAIARRENGAARIQITIFREMVPGRGLEPPRLAALVPETSASTNSAIRARGFPYGRGSTLVNARKRRLYRWRRPDYGNGRSPPRSRPP